MAGAASTANQPCHVRSISLPSSSHPIEVRVEEELRSLRSSMASSSETPQGICDRIRELGSLYRLVQDLIHLTSNQQILIHQVQKKFVEEELDESIRLLDLSSAVKDYLISMKNQIQGIQLALRRRESTTILNKVNDFVRSAKKAKKDINVCLRFFTQMGDKCMKKDDLPTAIRVLMEVKAIAISLLQIVSSFLSTQTRRRKFSRWTLISKALNRKKLASKEHEDVIESERLDIFTWCSSSDCISCKDVDVDRVLKAKSQLHVLEISIEGLEDGLDCLFRQMILTRVSLLNILSS